MEIRQLGWVVLLIGATRPCFDLHGMSVNFFEALGV